jgi:quercetin dioxygenase-like cupin family protein
MLDSVTLEQIRFGPGGGVYRIVATSSDTGNTHFAFEAAEPPGGGPPLHIHTREEEYFHVLEGEITFYIGGLVRTVREGGSAFVPRGTPHCFKNRSNREARVLVLFTPGDIEGFFDFGKAVDGMVPSEPCVLEQLAQLAPKYGLKLLGPSPL